MSKDSGMKETDKLAYKYNISVVHHKLTIETDHQMSLDDIWNTQKHWFASDVEVLIADEFGNTAIFNKEADNEG